MNRLKEWFCRWQGNERVKYRSWYYILCGHKFRKGQAINRFDKKFTKAVLKIVYGE